MNEAQEIKIKKDIYKLLTDDLLTEDDEFAKLVKSRFLELTSDIYNIFIKYYVKR